MAPRVLLDATAVPPDRGGVGRYVDSLAAALPAAGVRLAVACQAADAERYGALPGVDVHPGPPTLARRPTRLVWEQTGLVRLAARTGADVLHSPHYTLPLAAPCPVVVTLHDATFFTDPDLHSPVKARFFRTATRLAVRRAALCVVPSQATADEVARETGADPGRLAVAHHGVDTAAFRPPDAAALARVRAALGLGPDDTWVAFLGTLEPRKNVPALVEGWARACAGRPDPPVLVLAGARGWDDRVDAAVAAVPAPLRVLRPGYLPYDDLSALLGGAAVVAYPSLGEGFGLPVLEAMACGACVLTTRRLALPEVGGDAVAYTEPDPAAVAAALAALLDDPARRRALGAAATARASTATWERAAERHAAAYERAAATRRGVRTGRR